MKMQARASLFRGRADICSIFLDLEENQLRELQAVMESALPGLREGSLLAQQQ